MIVKTLTRKDLPEGMSEKNISELDVYDFKISIDEINKCELIIFEDEDYKKKVLKDRQNEYKKDQIIS